MVVVVTVSPEDGDDEGPVIAGGVAEGSSKVE